MKFSAMAGDARTFLRTPLPGHAVGLAWLGQSGFALRARGRLLLIDPYLSDHLARKYRDRGFPHDRLMPPPLEVADLLAVDAVLVTHRHSDHLDAPTLSAMAKANAACRFVVPAAEEDAALAAALPPDRLVLMDARQTWSLEPGVRVTALASAHEQLRTDAAGRHHHLGYLIDAGVRLYHSGDCVPYEGLNQVVASLSPHVALLPVNGRDAQRLAGGVAGNFHFHEAVDLCQSAAIGRLIVHHFGMFAFNTVDVDWLKRHAAAVTPPIVTVPDLHTFYVMEPEP